MIDLNFLKRIADSFKTIPLVSKNNKQSTNQTYNIFNVCAYIIYFYSKHDRLISNLKLQKVLYFLQAYFLVNKHHPLFRNDILFCDWGVFVEEAYNYYKSHAGLSISEREIYVRRLYHKDSLWFDTIPTDIECFSADDKKLMDIVLNKTLPYSSTKLLELSSKQVENMNLVYYKGTTKLIPKKEIIKYFNKQ